MFTTTCGSLPRKLNLPPELLAYILEYVAIPYLEIDGNEKIERPNRYREPLCPYLVSRMTLRNACLASKTVSDVARRLLYQDVMLLHATDVVLLFRTLLEEGCAGGQQRRRAQGGFRSSIKNLVCLVTLFDGAVIAETARAWRLLSLPEDMEAEDMTILWLADLSLGRILDEELNDAGYWSTIQRLFAALLALTTQLRSVTMQCPYWLSDARVYTPLDSVIRSLRRHRMIGANTLSHLETLVTHPEPGCRTGNGRVRQRLNNLFASLLELPTLRTLVARSCAGPLDVAGFGGPGALGLERVALYGSCSLATDIGNYAALCRGLRRLEIYGTPADVERLDAALFPVADRIRALVLRLMPGTPGASDGGEHAASGATAIATLATVQTTTTPASFYPGGGSRIGWFGGNYAHLTDLTIEDRILFRDAAQMESVGLVRRLPRSLVSLVLVEQWAPSSSSRPRSAASSFPDAEAEQEATRHLAAVARALLRASKECAERLPSLRRFAFDRAPQRRAWRATRADAAFRARCAEIRTSFADAHAHARPRADVTVEFLLLPDPSAESPARPVA